MLLEDAPVIVFLLVTRRVDWESLGGMGHGLVADRLAGDFFQRIDPAVTDTVGELLLLSPEDRLGQEADKGFPEDPFLDGRTGTHLGGGIKSHGHIKEFLVEERHTPLDTPGGQALVGSQAVVKVEFAQFAYGLLVKRSCVGRFMEIEITSKNLVGTRARRYIGVEARTVVTS